MFTGLVKEIGTVIKVTPNAEGKLLFVKAEKLAGELSIDDSVAINGVCQTVVENGKDSFLVQAVHTSLEKTTLAEIKAGDEVNLELALRLSDRLGGHLVQGHVNGVGEIISISNLGSNYNVKIKPPRDLMKYFISEGSITLDGISLTISECIPFAETLNVSVIPHTWENTVLKNRIAGSRINIEVDMLAKYVENMLLYKNKNQSKITMDWLSDKGF